MAAEGDERHKRRCDNSRLKRIMHAAPHGCGRGGGHRQAENGGIGGRGKILAAEVHRNNNGGSNHTAYHNHNQTSGNNSFIDGNNFTVNNDFYN